MAITNSRLVRLEGDQVTFTWKDYAADQRQREMTLSAEEFLRRFLLHVLPDRFLRIRYYGLFANRQRQQRVALCQRLLRAKPPPRRKRADWQEQLQRLTGVDPAVCTACGQAAMRRIEELSPLSRQGRAPPKGSS